MIFDYLGILSCIRTRYLFLFLEGSSLSGNK